MSAEMLVRLTLEADQLKAEIARLAGERDNARDVVADILGFPESDAGAITITIPNHQAAAWRKRAGLAYGTRAEARAADEEYQREMEFEATRSETDL